MMRALLVISNPNLPDIVYFSGDDGFCDEINKKAEQNGWIPEENLASHAGVDLHILLQYLQSLIASQQAMSSLLNCPYQSLLTENGSLVVIREDKEFMYIAINGDQSETKQFMLHRIFILQRVIEVFFGLNPERLSCNNERGRQEEVWGNITRILTTWEYLYRIEQSFLVEAIERLNVNQYLNGMCIQLLEETLRSSGDRNGVHALLLVKGKLLALFSSPNAPELQPSSILMMAIIAESFYPSPRTFTEDSGQFGKQVHAELMGRRVGTSQFYVGEDYATAAEDNKSDNSSEPYYSPSQGSSPIQSDHEDETQTPGREAPQTPTPVGACLGESNDQYSTPQGHPDIGQATNEPLGGTSHAPDPGKEDPYPGGFQLYVFLQQKHRKYIPHRLTLIPVLPGITMLMVSERRSSLGAHILDALDMLTKIYLKRAEVMQRGPKHTHVTRLDDLVDREIVGDLRTLRTDTTRKEKQILDSLGTFRGACSRSSTEESFGLGFESLCLQLTELFRSCFSQHRRLLQEIPPESVPSHQQFQALAQERLEYYKDYLDVRAEKNVPMTPYLEDCPGLVHFIHVERGENKLTAPSINIDYSPDEDSDKRDAHRSLVWRFIEKSRQFFQNEHTTVHFEMGDFQISSFLYFENSLGNVPTPPNFPKVPREGLYPGLLAENYFRFITDQCYQGSLDDVKCCELHCIHLAIVPLNVVAQQARKLRKRLWEDGSITATTINLL